MAPSIALVTGSVLREPDPDQEALVAAIEREGASVSVRAWDDPTVRWGDFDLCVIRSTWNYHHHIDAFLAWVDTTARVTRLCNSAAVVRWNAHKGYLLDLAARGVAVTPTALVRRGERVILAEVCAARGWRDVVIKPAVSAGSHMTLRSDSSATGQRHLDVVLAERDALVQPYVASVETYGERAVIAIDGALTHAVRKSPRFLHDEEEVSAALPISDDERALAERTLACTPEPVLYGRVDMARDGQGRPMLMELEVIEPSLFLSQHAPALQRLARRIARA